MNRIEHCRQVQNAYKMRCWNASISLHVKYDFEKKLQHHFELSVEVVDLCSIGIVGCKGGSIQNGYLFQTSGT